MPKPEASVEPTSYSRDYFLTECDGYRQYLDSEGELLSPRLQALWKFLRLRPGMKVLDVGCGRGEFALHCAARGAHTVGVDYSPVALELAQHTISRRDGAGAGREDRLDLSLSNAMRLPFADRTFDRAVMSDLVEHLQPTELRRALREARRVLTSKGCLLIHTMPNLWYYWIGYPLFRLVEKLRGVSLPADPRDRFEFSHVHVNEQTPHRLGRLLRDTGFSDVHVWLHDYRDYSHRGTFMKHSMQLLTRLPLTRPVFCDDIFARAHR